MAQQYDLVIVGMGSAGLTAAEFASTLGLRVAAVERHRVGGDCLWTGCVPSKALLASAKVAQHMRTAGGYGITAVEPQVDTAKVWARIREIQDRIASTDDSRERYEEMGITFHMGEAHLTGPTSLTAGGTEIATRFILLCTGSRPVVPPIPGLQEAGFLTSETVFALDRAPESVIAIGGGPIAVELSQAFTRLGIATTVLQRDPGILPRDEPSLASLLADRLRAEGLDLCLDVRIDSVAVEDGMKVVRGTQGGEHRDWRAAEILVGAGRLANVEGLGLEALGIAVGPRGVQVDARMRTSVPSIYAAGDLAGRFLFTHSAGYEAANAVRNMFFPGSAKVTDSVPWCTFTDPELAHAGLTLAQAEARHGAADCTVWRLDLDRSDRARADGAEAGAIVVVTAKKKIVGAHILAPAAGEMIHELALAIQQELKLEDLSGLIHVYPTVSIGIQQLAAEATYAKARKYRWLVRRGRAA